MTGSRILAVPMAAILLLCVMPMAWQMAGDVAPEAHIAGQVPPASFSGTGIFTENLGQLDDAGVLFYSQSGGLAFTANSIIFHSAGPHQHSTVRMAFVGANDVTPVGMDPVSWRSHHFLGNESSNWHTDAANYRGVRYNGLWDGIDLVYNTDGRGLKYDIMLAPGADAGRVRIGVRGHDGLVLTETGALSIGTGLGPGTEIVDSCLDVFYADDPSEKIPAEFVILENDTYTFSLQGRDMSRAVIIDPLVYSTFLGGAGWDGATAVAVDPEGCAYVTGHTDFTKFTSETGNFRPNPDNGHDIFIFKLAPDGASVIYSAFLGGREYDAGHGIDVDSDGCAYITGVTFSSDFPVTDGALYRAYGGVGDAFVTKLDRSGGSLVYSTYLGGRHDDVGHDIAVDAQGRAHVAGHTWSSDFPVTPGSFSPAPNGDADAFLTKLSDTGDYLVHSTYLGGPGSDRAVAVALDPEGNAFVTGITASPDFPVTEGALNTTHDSTNVFVTKFPGSGKTPLYSAVLGGSGSDLARGIAVDTLGRAHVVGDTDSVDFPVMDGAGKSGRDVFVFSLNASGDYLLHSTRLGGSLDDLAGGISLDCEGRIFVTGHTYSADFPVTSGALSASHSGGSDAFIAMLDSASLGYSSYLGSSLDDRGLGISMSGTGCAFVAGETDSANFPVTTLASWPSHSGGTDAFLAKLDITRPVAMAGPDMAVNESTPVEFNGSASTDNEAVVNHTWEFNDGLADVIMYGPNPAHVFTVPGEYPVALTVTDSVGNSDTDVLNLTVLMYPLPIARTGPDLVAEENVPVRFDGSASTDNVGIARYVWTFHDGINNASAEGPSPAWVFRVPGTYTVTLNVTDGDSNWDAEHFNVTVLDTTCPIVVLEPSVEAEAGSPLYLDGTGSTDNVGIVNHTWSFTHNGTVAYLYGPAPDIRFWEPGEHSVVLTVTDGAGNSASNIMLVTVRDPGGGIGAENVLGIVALTISSVILAIVMFGKKRREQGGGHD